MRYFFNDTKAPKVHLDSDAAVTGVKSAILQAVSWSLLQ